MTNAWWRTLGEYSTRLGSVCPFSAWSVRGGLAHRFARFDALRTSASPGHFMSGRGQQRRTDHISPPLSRPHSKFVIRTSSFGRCATIDRAVTDRFLGVAEVPEAPGVVRDA